MNQVVKNQKLALYLGGGSLLILLTVGLLVARFLTNTNQDVRNQASTGTGVAEVKITPTTLQLNPKETKIMTISFNTQGKIVSGISVRLKYTFNGTTPELTASEVTPVIINSNSSWSCPVTQVNIQGKEVRVDVGCIFNSTNGYQTNEDQSLATFKLTASSTAEDASYTLVFDPEATVITLKDTGEDIAAIPKSIATVTVVGQATNTPTPKPSPTPEPKPTQSGITTQTNTQGLSCNASCQSNRDCRADLACLDGYCRNPRCTSDTSCKCQDKDVAKETQTETLPESGAIDLTLMSLIIGSLFVLGGLSLVIYNRDRDWL